MYDQIVQMMEHPDFPEKVQFWSRIGNDLWKQKEWRLDLKHPSFYWDNNQKQSILVIPDLYMFGQWVQNTPQRECLERNSATEGYFKKDKYQWANKKSKAFFRGAINGEMLRMDLDHKGDEKELKET